MPDQPPKACPLTRETLLALLDDVFRLIAMEQKPDGAHYFEQERPPDGLYFLEPEFAALLQLNAASAAERRAFLEHLMLCGFCLTHFVDQLKSGGLELHPSSPLMQEFWDLMFPEPPQQ